jgi:hypothetical protein
MLLEVLHVPDCPSAPLLTQRLQEVLSDLPLTVEVTYLVIADRDEAAAARMNGSPTLLINGVDRLTEPTTAPSVSCRLYLDEDGRTAGAPSVDVLRRVLGIAQT